MRTIWTARVCLALACWAGAALAQDDPDARTPRAPLSVPVALEGTLAKLHATGRVAIGYRDSSVPFSYLNQRQEPIGYSIDLCRALVRQFEDALHKPLAIDWVPVTSANRIDAVESGQADLECGSTTANLERRKRVAFSPTIFVSGTKLMVRKGAGIRSFRDLAGKTVAVTRGTTNEKAMQDLAEKFKLDFKQVPHGDHAASFAALAAGQADAFATDDVLLYGLIAENGARGAPFQVVGEFLSYDPYGIMFRRNDAQFARLMQEAFQRLAEDREIERQYTRWFLRRLPSGISIDLPMSPQLETILQTLVAKPE